MKKIEYEWVTCLSESISYHLTSGLYMVSTVSKECVEGRANEQMRCVFRHCHTEILTWNASEVGIKFYWDRCWVVIQLAENIKHSHTLPLRLEKSCLRTRAQPCHHICFACGMGSNSSRSRVRERRGRREVQPHTHVISLPLPEWTLERVGRNLRAAEFFLRLISLRSRI